MAAMTETQLADYKKKEEQRMHEYLAKRFGIPVEDIVWHNSGICYSRTVVRTQESADKITTKVKGQTVNGGYLHGMGLGGQTKYVDEKSGEPWYDVTC